MSRTKPYAPNNTNDVSLSNKVKAMVKEEVVELLEKDLRKCYIVISNLEEDHDNASTIYIYSNVCTC